MKKNAIIEMLQKIPGNPDIVLWNGYVGDYQHVDSKLVPGTLVKQTLANYLELCRLEACGDLDDPDYQHSAERLAELKSLHKKVCQWKENQWVTVDDIKSKRYSAKRIYYMQAKPRNQRYHDRLGSVGY